MPHLSAVGIPFLPGGEDVNGETAQVLATLPKPDGYGWGLQVPRLTRCRFRLKAKTAVAFMRKEAKKRGLDKLTEEESLDLVQKARKR